MNSGNFQPAISPLAVVPDYVVDEQECKLQCDLRIHIGNPSEYIQSALLQSGVFEPTVTNLITKLLKPGDELFDIGGNIGYFTLVGASRGATVHAFEPVPRLAENL